MFLGGHQKILEKDSFSKKKKKYYKLLYKLHRLPCQMQSTAAV